MCCPDCCLEKCDTNDFFSLHFTTSSFSNKEDWGKMADAFLPLSCLSPYFFLELAASLGNFILLRFAGAGSKSSSSDICEVEAEAGDGFLNITCIYDKLLIWLTILIKHLPFHWRGCFSFPTFWSHSDPVNQPTNSIRLSDFLNTCVSKQK